MFEKTYYLEPEGPAARPYVLLREALENAGQVAITKIAIRQRESLAALRVLDGVLALHTMRWPDEIRTPDFAFLDEDITVRPQELKMAEALIASMTGEFDPTEFTDDYREAMTALLEAKQSGGEVQQVPEVPDDGAAVVDLMSALRRSVERARGGSADDERTPTRKPGDEGARRRRLRREAPAKKARPRRPRPRRRRRPEEGRRRPRRPRGQDDGGEEDRGQAAGQARPPQRLTCPRGRAARREDPLAEYRAKRDPRADRRAGAGRPAAAAGGRRRHLRRPGAPHAPRAAVASGCTGTCGSSATAS